MEDEQSGAIAVEDIQALKEKARAMVDEDKKSRQKRNFVDDEELFERAKRIREQMDEGASWFRKQIDMDTASRSMS
jgi:nucleosome binding factor SPN SPT16 subunit